MRARRSVDSSSLCAVPEQTWQALAASLEPALWKELHKKGFVGVCMFDASSDLLILELARELEGILQRNATEAEIFAFRNLVVHSAKGATFKRRCIRAALDNPALREKPEALQIWTKRDELLARIAPGSRLAEIRFPTASTRERESRDDQRKRLVAKFCAVLQECAMPIMQSISFSLAPERIMLRMGAGKRSSTLKQKLQAFAQMKEYMQATIGKVFPDHPWELQDYLCERAEEPCGATVPQSIMSMVNFVEECGGRLEEHKIGKLPQVRALANEIQLELAVGKIYKKRKARQYLLCQVAAWELGVDDVSYYDTLRVTMWAKLVRIWAAFRTADGDGVPVMRVAISAGNLEGPITMTKTSGAGKRVGELMFHVSGKAYIINPNWLANGFQLYQASRTPRSFFLPLPSKDLQTFSTKEPTYIQNCTTARKLVEEARHVECEGDLEGFGNVYKPGKDSITLPGAQGFWSGHSDRGTLPTWCSALGISTDRVNKLGRWRPEDSEEYCRVAKGIILATQAEVAARLRSAGNGDICHEAEVLKDLRTFCIDRGLAEADVEEMVERICVERITIAQEVSVVQQDIIELNPVDVESEDRLEQKAALQKYSDGQYIVSLTKGEAYQTLHQFGRCYRVPGLHYARHVVLAVGEEPEGGFNKLCKDCFPKGIVEFESSEGLVDSSSSESSDSSESN